MKITPAEGLSSKEALFFLSEETRDPEESGKDSSEITVGSQSPGSAQSKLPVFDEHIVTRRESNEEGAIVIEGLGNPMRLLVRKSGVGTAELLLDEIEGTFQTQSIGRN